MAVTQAITYSYDTWVANFPEFAACSSAQGQAWFNRSGLYFANDICNPAYPVIGATLFEQLIYMLTSHIAWISAPRDSSGNPASSGKPPPSIVGRISSASEGSVNVSTEWKDSGSPSEAWYIQTPYGAEFWAATAQFRTMRYAARPTIVAGTVFPFVPRTGWRR